VPTHKFQLSIAGIAALLTLGVISHPALAQGAALAGAQGAAATAADVPYNPLKEAYFGEQHLHTTYSLDAFLGGEALSPDEAYKFAQGAEVEVSGVKFKIDQPLDWAAVTDHAEYLGEMYSTLNVGALGSDNPQVVELRGLTDYNEREEWFLKYVIGSNRGGGKPAHPPFWGGPETSKSGWKKVLEATEANNRPGRFTTLPAYEWSGAPRGGNLHRNVFFRDIKKVPEQAMGYAEFNRETELWQWLAELEKQGIRGMAIPHNSNASKGMMFDANMPDGKPLTKEYVSLRNRFERSIEMMQIKGNSEVHRSFWAADEFADFENADSLGTFSGRDLNAFGRVNWVRYGLGKGLQYQKTLGVNPYHYGIVGGTDNHNGLMSNVAEDNFMAGSHGAADGTVERRREDEVGGWLKGPDLNPGSITGVWAPQNTREAIYDAMYNRETFATSGPRIKVRFFGQFGAAPAAGDFTTMIEQGYANGVPMGGTLNAGTGAPVFTVWAVKGPREVDGNLDRIQIIKSWVDDAGEPQDQVFDVAWSGERKPDANGKLPPVGNTVDVKTATFTNTIGAVELKGTWTDPSFDTMQNAVYYARVIQIPTPRWSTFDAVRAELPLQDGVASTVQERAWTSPIWYTPAAKSSP
jgi:hypothetical protein